MSAAHAAPRSSDSHPTPHRITCGFTSRIIRLVAASVIVCTFNGNLSNVSRAEDDQITSDAGTSHWEAVQRTVADIDRLMADHWRQNEITPAPPASQSEFLRRVTLDIAGRIPQVSVARDFLADDSADSRRALVDRLLNGPTYVTNFADVWQAALIPEASSDPQLRLLRPGFEAWLRDQLREEVAYDDMVRRLLTSPIANLDNNVRGSSEPSPEAFFRVKQLKAENMAGATARVFLGVRLECAQCHHHPFDVWKQEQFWSFAAFFSGVQAENPLAAIVEQPQSRSIKIPGTDRLVEARFLSTSLEQPESSPEWLPDATARETLAAWTTAGDNPWFARMAVNRLWGHFFGRGLVDPVDDFSEANTPAQPEVLNRLAEAFVERDFDLKFLIRVIVSTQAYQLSSQQTHDSQAAPEVFARMNVRGLTPRQIFSSLAVALGTFQPFTVPGQFNDQPAETEFLDTFSNENDSVIERPTTILQALVLMNGDLVSAGTSVENSRTLRAIIEYPLMKTPDRIESLYLATLTRRPTAAELDRLTRYVDETNPHGDTARALSDVFWALLNSSEFLFNH